MQVHVPQMRSAVRLLRARVGEEDSGSWRTGLRQVGEGQERWSLESGQPTGAQGTQGQQRLGLNLVLASLRLITSLNGNPDGGNCSHRRD